MFETISLNGPFGVQITGGLDVLTPLAPAQVEGIDRRMVETGLVLIRDPPTDVDQQVTWTRQFGPLDQGFK